MKKYLYLAVACCLGLASCEDVPAPYEIFDQGGTGGGGGSTESGLPYSSSSLNTNWTVVTPEGTPWSLGNTYAKATGYDSGSKETTKTESWLVSPVINTTNDKNAAHITVEHVVAYVNASSAPLSNHTMWITTDFDGESVGASSWTQLDYHPVERTDKSSWDFYAADEIAIPSEFVGKSVYIAFKFVCGSSSTTWELKNFNVLAGEAAAGSTPDKPDVPTTGAGSKAEPYNVASAQSASGNAWVEGYIVGYVDGQTYASGATFAVPTEAQTEILLADAADTKDASACIPVQLPAGDIRSALDLFANPTLLGQKVELYGSLEKYFGVNGLKSTSCAILGDKVIGKDPEGTTPDVPVGDAKGTGTAADPFNVAGVLNYTNALPADQNSDKEVYFKGIVSSVKEISPVGNYNNATFYISDDGSKNNEFYIFRCLGLNKADIESADLVKEGDVVLMCGKVVNYKGNTPETVQKEAYIVSINGEGGNENPDQPGVDPDQPSDGAPLISVADFLEKKDPNTTYRLSGKIANVVAGKEQYGNFDLVDETGSIYIYGLVDETGAYTFRAHGLKEGDELVLEGKYAEFNGKSEINKALYISHKAGSGVDPDQPGDEPGTPDVSGDCITFDISANCFGIPSDKQTSAGTYSCGDYSITLTPAGEGNGYYYNSKDKYVILGKQGATLEFNGFDFDVAKIEITGRDAASGNTKQNIYVRDEAVSTETTGVKGTNTYVIKEGYRAAGTHYVLKVTSNHNTQFTEIKVYKAQ